MKGLLNFPVKLTKPASTIRITKVRMSVARSDPLLNIPSVCLIRFLEDSRYRSRKKAGP